MGLPRRLVIAIAAWNSYFLEIAYSKWHELFKNLAAHQLADLDCIRNVARRVKAEVDAGHEVAVVVSAMSGTTNQLVGWASDIGALHDAQEYDTIVATGEQVTVGLLAIALQNIGIDARSWLGWQIPIPVGQCAWRGTD